MTITLEKTESKKNNEKSTRIFLMESCDLQPRNRSFQYYGGKSLDTSSQRPVPFWMQNTKIKSLNLKYNNEKN